jgi:2-hydroxy-6-oxonona-2,4-dienedioate hydrolase
MRSAGLPVHDGERSTMQAFTEENTSRILQTKNGPLHYNEAGQGYPLILIHGSGPGATGWTNFSPNLPVLAQKYRVIAMDLPGWGRSRALDPDGPPMFTVGVDAVIDLMDGLNLKTAALLGNSLGAAICLEFAARHPERMSHMITMGSGAVGFPSVYTPGGLTEGLRIVMETFAAPTPANFRRMVSIFVYDQSFVTDELCEMRSRASLSRGEHLQDFPKIMRRGMTGLTDRRPGETASRLATLEQPCLFVHGRDDRVVPMEGTLNLVSWVPRSQAHIFNRCGHWTQIEHAAAFNKLVDGFLETNGVG